VFIFIHLAIVAFQNRKILIKFDLIAVQGHPRSSILVSIESSYVTSYLSLIVTLALSSTVFEILMLKARKWLNFPTPPLFEAFARGEPLRVSGWNLASEN